MTQPASAEICGDCHRAIAEGWKKSAHARAMESRLFQEALRKAGEDFGADARKVRLGCHAPLAVKLGDFDLVRKTSWEGVTCDFCHSIREVDVSGTNPKARVELSNVKSGQEVRADKHTLQSGTTNDPVLQGGVLYLNAEKTAYIYYDGNALKWHPPTSFEVTIG